MSHTTITFIGRRESYRDRLYGSGLTFDKGQSRTVPDALARQFLRHADCFVRAEKQAKAAAKAKDDTASVLEQAAIEKQEQDKSQLDLQMLYDQVAIMDKEGLTRFALVNYRHEVDKRATLPTMREQVIGLIDQFGVV